MLRLLDIDFDLVARRHTAGQERRSDTEPCALFDLVTDRIDR